jgi:acetone carboxylase, beta subunit
MQSWAGYSYSNRIHAVTHVHPEPLVDRRCVWGVTERIDVFGEEIIPLYEVEVSEAAQALVRDRVEAIVIHFIFSYINPSHERRARTLVEEVLRNRGVDVPIYLGSDLRPVIRENSRLNAALIEAYTVGPVRRQLEYIERAIQSRGYERGLQTLFPYGDCATFVILVCTRP